MVLNQYKHNKIFILFCLLSVIVIMSLLVPMNFQNDTFYTIKIGQRIIEQGFLPIDDLTFLAGLPYSYPHWLYDCGIFLLYKMGGFKAIYLSSMILSIILTCLMLFVSYQICKNRFVAYFVVVATVMSLSINFTARAQLVTYILVVIEYGLLVAYAKTKLARVPFFIAMVIISTLIVNLHCAVWILFFLLALPFVVEKKISHYFYARNYPISSRMMLDVNSRYSALFILSTLLICTLTGFLSPLGYTPFIYLYETYQGISTQVISEHQPMVPIKNLTFIIFSIELVYLIFFTRCKFYMSEILLLTGLIILSLMSIRQLAILLLINALIAPRLLTQAFEESCSNRLHFYTKQIGTIKGGIVTLIIVTLLSYSHHYYSLTKAKITPYSDTDKSHNRLSSHYDDNYPVKAMDYLSLHVDPSSSRVFSDYALASYVSFRGFKTFVDSRADLYTIEFNKKHDYLNDLTRLRQFNQHYESFFEQYKINYILLSKADPLKTYIDYDNRYDTLYLDDEFVIYKR